MLGRQTRLKLLSTRLLHKCTRIRSKKERADTHRVEIGTRCPILAFNRQQYLTRGSRATGKSSLIRERLKDERYNSLLRTAVTQSVCFTLNTCPDSQGTFNFCAMCLPFGPPTLELPWPHADAQTKSTPVKHIAVPVVPVFQPSGIVN